MVTKFVVRWVSVLAILAVGLSNGAAFAAPESAAACPGLTASSVFSAVCSLPSALAARPAQEQVQELTVLSAATGSPATFPVLASQASPEAASSVDLTVQEALVLSTATSNSVGFASLASQAAQTAQ